MERWQEYLGGDKGGWGWGREKMTERGCRGWSGKRREDMGGRWQGGREAGGRITGGQKERLRRKVGWRGEVMGAGEERSGSSCDTVHLLWSLFLPQLPGVFVCMCVCVCVQWGSIRQEVKASQDACPIVALVVFRRCSAPRPLPEWRASEAAFPLGRLSVSVISSNWRQEEESGEKNRELLFIEQTGCLKSVFFFFSWHLNKANHDVYFNMLRWGKYHVTGRSGRNWSWHRWHRTSAGIRRTVFAKHEPDVAVMSLSNEE